MSSPSATSPSTSAATVVIPTRDRPEALRSCLAALLAQEPVDGGFEVVVVDDGGELRVEPVVEQFAGRIEVRLVHAEGGGPARARNLGADAARGGVLAFTDDDCRPEPGWLRSLAATAAGDAAVLAGGRVDNLLVDNPYASASQLVHELVYAHFNVDPDDARFFASNNMAVDRRAFQRAGGFDESFGRPASEDREFCDRWRHGGGRLVYVDDAVVGHAHEMGLRGYVRQHFRYGVGASLYHSIRARRGSGRMADDVGFHLDPANWRRGLAKLGRSSAPLGLGALLIVWQLSNAAGFLADRLGRRR